MQQVRASGLVQKLAMRLKPEGAGPRLTGLGLAIWRTSRSSGLAVAKVRPARVAMRTRGCVLDGMNGVLKGWKIVILDARGYWMVLGGHGKS